MCLWDGLQFVIERFAAVLWLLLSDGMRVCESLYPELPLTHDVGAPQKSVTELIQCCRHPVWTPGGIPRTAIPLLHTRLWRGAVFGSGCVWKRGDFRIAFR